MNTVQEIERAICELNPEGLAAFRAWFATFDVETWDRQLETDAASGRLDFLAEEAIRDLHEGRCVDL